MIAVFFLAGCSTAQLNTAWERTKTASYNAATDPVTWAPALGAAVLYPTGYDDDITDHFREHHLIDGDEDDAYRDINRFETLLTAMLVDDEYDQKAKRLLVEFSGIEAAKQTSTFLEGHISKESPDGSHDGAIGSHHALDAFAASAMNRRNVEAMQIPVLGKYALNSISYTTAAASALSRVQDGGHSFADQLVSVSVGNFVGLFIHDLFLLDPATTVSMTFDEQSAFIKIGYRY